MRCAYHVLFHCDDSALPCKSNIMSCWWGEFYLLRRVGLVRGEE